MILGLLDWGCCPTSPSPASTPARGSNNAPSPSLHARGRQFPPPDQENLISPSLISAFNHENSLFRFNYMIKMCIMVLQIL
jgi:hypothetical protein